MSSVYGLYVAVEPSQWALLFCPFIVTPLPRLSCLTTIVPSHLGILREPAYLDTVVPMIASEIPNIRRAMKLSFEGALDPSNLLHVCVAKLFIFISSHLLHSENVISEALVGQTETNSENLWYPEEPCIIGWVQSDPSLSQTVQYIYRCNRYDSRQCA